MRGGIFRKIWACWKILWAAKRLKNLTLKSDTKVFLTNTPRTHFVLFVAKRVWRMKGKWIAVFHDFTTRPDFLLNGICDEADLIIANSMPTRAFLRGKIDSQNFPKIRIIENGLDFNEIPAAKPTKKIEKVLLLGRIDPQKGQIFAVQAADIMQKIAPELNFFIVGDTVKTDKRTTKYDKEIKNFAKKQKLENVHFLPAVDDPFEAICSADLVLVLPTKPETFGRVVIEALAMGKLVIAFDEVGPRDILDQFEKFVLQKSGKTEVPILRTGANAEELAAKIKYFMDNPKERDLFVKYAREFVQVSFDFRETKKGLFRALEG